MKHSNLLFQTYYGFAVAYLDFMFSYWKGIELDFYLSFFRARLLVKLSLSIVNCKVCFLFWRSKFNLIYARDDFDLLTDYQIKLL